jgi:hypothetical protein
VRGVLLEDEGVVNAMWLAAAGADLDIVRETSPHGSVERSSNFIVLLQSRAATQDLGKPELANSAFHMPNLALCGSRSLDPL